MDGWALIGTGGRRAINFNRNGILPSARAVSKTDCDGDCVHGLFVKYQIYQYIRPSLIPYINNAAILERHFIACLSLFLSLGRSLLLG